ncbi:hypothetical protein D3C85_1548340 [compost metagenome]
MLAVVHVGRVGDDQVELPFDTAQHIAVVGADITGLGQLGIHRRQAQRPWIDIHRQHFGVRPGKGDNQSANAGPAAYVHRSPHGFRALLQMGFDQLRKTIAVGSEEHRVALRGRIRRMGNQQAPKA